MIRGLSIESQLKMHSVDAVWPRAVGTRLAANTRPGPLQGGMLLVEARSAVWMNEAALMREAIVAGVNRELGSAHVRQVRFKLGAGFPPLPASKPAEAAPTEADIAAAEKSLRDAGSTEGAHLLARALALQSKRAKR